MSDGSCPIGPLQIHTWNHERTECIWCGPGQLAWRPGRWLPVGEGGAAWSAEAPVPSGSVPTGQEASDGE